MIVASVCSGIGGAELAFADIASHAFMAETDPFARAVLAHRFPGIPLHGDFTQVKHDGPVDVLVGGTPCQSFSVAGLRGGMADQRGNLALEFLRLADRLRARWVLWENVPGVLSSAGGRDFGSFLGGLGELGYGWAYRSLDAQYFGLAQRRCRVFVVGCLGDWRRAAAVLFEPTSLRGNSPPRREAREEIANALTERADQDGTNSEGQRLIAPTLESGGNRTGGHRPPGTTVDTSDSLITTSHEAARGDVGLIAPPITSNPYGDHESREGLLVASTLRVPSHGATWRDDGCDNLVAFGGNNTAGAIDVATAVNAHGGTGRGTPLVAFQTSQSGTRTTDTHATLDANNGSRRHNGIASASLVRRLTPTECERLQGFPDGWTAITYRGKPAADGNRYRALGNAFAVPVVRWIARRVASSAELATLPFGEAAA